MIMILLLLVVQAYCELTLPGYTSDIVDVGIQYKGVKYPIPEEMSEETYENLSLFLDDTDLEVVNRNYKKEQDCYKADLDALEEEELTRLENAMLQSEMLVFLFTSDSEEAIAVQKQMTEAMGMSQTEGNLMEVLHTLPEEAIASMKASIEEKLQEYPDYMAEAMGIQFVTAEYERMGRDMEAYQMDYMKSMGFRMLIIAVVAMFASVMVGFLSSKLAAYTAKDIRGKVFSKVMGFSNTEMNQFSTSSLITRCTNDVQQIQMVLTILFRMVAFAPIMGLGAVFKVLRTTTSMAWIIALAVIAVLLVVAVLMLVAMPKFKIMQKLVDQLNLVAREILTGLPVIRAFGREEKEEKRFEDASRELMKTQLFTSRAMVMMMPTMMFIMNGISVLIIWVGANQIDTGTIQVGEMIAFLTYAMHIVISFLMISMVSIMLPRASVAAERIDEVLDSETQIIDAEDPVTLPENGTGEVTFSHVSFRYPNAEEDALTDIDFTAEAGKTTAIIGSTGCGKSTLVHLIPRLFDVSQGSITIDGVDIRKVRMKELRETIGFVPQKGTLFSGTIASNICFGNVEATEEEMKEAARIAQADSFIREKEKQYESEVAQGGNNVSGGQKQRLAIARAIAKQPKIYVFDDSFSALDYKTDAALRKALHEKVGGAVVLIVAQRISTILHADRILVLEDGKIVGQGTHEELLAGNEVYQQIAASQMSREELEGKGC
ncbi:MAG: ABC transporter ATP-binding protein [Lachnospiraceae bacterium]|nr:ABC transporter ATP-binding protein [Lachnospiraceae bacterium]